MYITIFWNIESFLSFKFKPVIDHTFLTWKTKYSWLSKVKAKPCNLLSLSCFRVQSYFIISVSGISRVANSARAAQICFFTYVSLRINLYIYNTNSFKNTLKSVILRIKKCWQKYCFKYSFNMIYLYIFRLILALIYKAYRQYGLSQGRES